LGTYTRGDPPNAKSPQIPEGLKRVHQPKNLGEDGTQRIRDPRIQKGPLVKRVTEFKRNKDPNLYPSIGEIPLILSRENYVLEMNLNKKWNPKMPDRAQGIAKC